MNPFASRGFRRLCSAAAVGLVLSATSAANAQDFIKTLIVHVPGGPGSNLSSIAINDNNWVVWARGAGNASQVTLWNTQTVQDLGMVNGNNRDPRINNSNVVIWTGVRAPGEFVYDVYRWSGGVVTNLTEAIPDMAADIPALNDAGDIAVGGPGMFPGELDIYYLANGTNQWRNLTAFDPDGDHTGPAINNAGQISWERTIDTPEGGRTDLYIQSISDLIATENFSSATIASQSEDLNVYNSDLNDSGVAVWRQYAGDNWDVFSFNPATFTRNNLSATLTGSFGSFQPIINNAGVIVWYRWIFGNTYELYWRVGNTTALVPLGLTNTRNVPIAINNNGALAYATGDSTQGYDIYLATPARSISGTITLQSATTNASPLTFTFRPQTGSAFDRTVTPAANGTFTVGGLPSGNYTVSIKGSKWLRKNVLNVNVTNGNVSGITAELKGGDANNDNYVDISDLLALIGAYNKVSPNAGFLEAADFNNDGKNDIADLLLLISNYNTQGDL
jgi:hypothetical protein